MRAVVDPRCGHHLVVTTDPTILQGCVDTLTEAGVPAGIVDVTTHADVRPAGDCGTCRDRHRHLLVAAYRSHVILLADCLGQDPAGAVALFDDLMANGQLVTRGDPAVAAYGVQQVLTRGDLPAREPAWGDLLP